MKSLFKHLQAIAKQSTRGITKLQPQLTNSKSGEMLLPQLVPASVLKKVGLLGLLAAGQLLVAPKAFAATPLTLYRSFTGHVDYVVTGGSLRTQPNTSDPCAITTTSTQTLSGIPSTATIEAAYLYWAASGSTIDSQVTLAGQNVIADRTFTDTFSGNNFFSGFKDVTSIVATQRNASYTFGGLTINTSSNYCSNQTVLGGWSLIVIYRDNTTVSRVNALNVYDGFQASQNTSRDFTLSNITVSSAPVAKFTSLVWEGDSTLGGATEKLKFEGNNLFDSLNPVDNPFNSTITSLSLSNTYGVDLDTFNVSAYATPGATSVTGTVSSGQDLFFQSAAIVGVSILAADLSLTKTVSNTNPTVGSNVTFTITVNNSGTDNASGVTVKDLLPAGLTYVSDNSGGAYNSGTGIWNVATLNNTQSKSLQITARVNNTGSITNTAEVNTSSLPDPDSTPNNNNASEDDQQSVTITPTSLFGYKSVKLANDADGSASLTPGDTVTWTVTYINTSSVDIPNFQVTDALSSGVTVAGTPTVIATGLGQVTPTVNNGFNGSSTTSLFSSPVLLKAGGILTVNIPTLLNSATANTMQSNQATGMGANLPAVGIPTDNIDNTSVNLPVGVTVSLGSISQTQTSNIDPTTVNVGTAPVVSGYKSVRLSNDADSSTTVTPGDTLTWTVTYTNRGTVDIPNFQVTDPLPNGMTVAGTSTITALGLGQATPTANSSYNGTGNNTLFNSGVTLKAGGTITISIPVTVNAGSTGTKTNQATGTGSNLPASGVKTDNIDNTTIGLPGGISIAPGSITQAQTTSIDPTAVIVNSSLTGLALGFKSVKLTQDLDVSGGPTPGDILTWTISYTNTGTADIKNFQITDSLATGLSAGGTPIIGATGIAQVTPIANSAYDRVGNNALFNTAIDLKAGSTITVNLPVKIDANVAVTTLTNQAVGSGSNLPAVNTDNIDNLTTGLPLGVLVPSGSIVQTQNPGIDPTSLQIGFPISGTLYQDSNGNDSFNSGETTLPVNITVKLLNSTGTATIATTMTNASGQYSFTGITNGNYKIQVDTSDTDIPAGLTLGTPNNLAITVSSSPLTGQNFGFDVAAGSCNVGGGTPDAAIAPYISAEVANNVIATRSLVDTLDDAWRTATGGPSSGTVQPWFGTNSSPGSVNSFRYLDPSTSSNVNATVQLVQVNINGTTNCAGVSSTTSSNPLLATGASLQDSSPRPASLYSTANQPAFWNQTIVSGNDGRRFAVRFTFDQPVKSFGAWFGDLETRTVNGTPAVLRLLDAFGNRIGNDISIQPTTLYDGTPPDPETINQNQCGNVVGGGFSPTNIGCGNSSTRWVGFVDSSSTPRVSQVLVIVGDDDFNDDGDTEILSFIGANTIPVASNPNLLLVKRITAINGVALNQFVDDPSTNNDNAPNWPLPLDSGSNISTYLRGVVNGGVVRPGDELEYTIYFLSNGNTPITNVNLCDLVPANSTLIPNSFNGSTPTDGGLPGVDSGIALAIGSTTPTAYLTNANDAPDRGQFFAPGTTPSASCSGANTNGAVVVKVVTSPTTLPNAIAPGNPSNSYGFIRFRARVN